MKLTEKERIKRDKLLFRESVRKDKAKKKKQYSVSTLKKKLWKIVSEYIRRKYANSDWMVQCITCGITKHYKEMQAGHWIPAGSCNYLRFVETNIHPQCYGCNIGKSSNPIEYRIFMDKTYWKNFVEELLSLRNELKKFTTPELLDMIDTWQDKLDKLNEK